MDSFVYSDFLLRVRRRHRSHYSFKNETARTINFIGSIIMIVSVFAIVKNKESEKKPVVWGIMILVGLVLFVGSYIVDHLLL